MGLTENDVKKVNIKCVQYEPELCSDRISDSEMARFSENEKKLAYAIATIKLNFAKEKNISSTKAYEVLADMCQISVTAFKYAISCTKGHTANRRFLYKLSVGLQMEIEEANELFELENGKLSEHCLEDLICMCALRDKDNIYDFIEEFEMRTESKLSLRERKTDKIK